jgi:leucyl/phenylalanyl-tRNA--protein transferase
MAREPHSSDDLFLPVGIEYEPLPADVQLSSPRYFPPPTATTPDGLLCVGGRLSPEWLLDAYRHGIFPWPMWEDEPVAWWSPDPRAIFELDGLHISRRLRRTLRQARFRVTHDRDFAGVIQGCATAGDRKGNTWLTAAMVAAYSRLHELGHAHSVEAWLDGELVGGTYGVAIGGLFAAESMFHRERDASKVALVYLVEHLLEHGYRLFDIQQLTPHSARLGAKEISRVDYLRRLAAVVDLPVTFDEPGN